MAVDFSAMLFSFCQNQFGRQVVITPVVSAPGAPAYSARGIYGTRPVDIVIDDAAMAMVSDQETILDIRDIEFFDAGHVLPRQGDLVYIPAEGRIPAEGDFEITDTDNNAGGETTLAIRQVVPPEP